MRIFLVLFFFCFSFTTEIIAQGKTDSVTVPGGHFNASRSRATWMGANYRKEWNTPITVPVVNLATEHGGLTPTKKGGGKQTKSLKLDGADGKQYTFRSITKYITSKTLPGNLQSDAAADLVSDGVSASYPYAALSMSVLSEAAGVPHGNPKIVMVPDDPRLGEFREEFKNLLVLYEEKVPDSVSKDYDTDEVADKLKDDNDNRVDQLAMLRVRILDMYVMDLDRHEGQWNWGAWDNGKGKTFYPIAKDRDQAFYINQGILPGLVKARSLVPQLEGFKPKAHSIARFNFSSRNLDRFFLNELSEADWQKEAESFVGKMTDEVIERAIAQQPKEIRDIHGPWIIQTLKDRRNFIVADVMEYYRFLAETVSITGSDKKEQYSIIRNDDGSVQITVFKMNKDGELTNNKMYDRTFNPLVTKELRIYGFGGEDKFVVSGPNDKIKIRLIGGDGADMFENGTKDGSIFIYDRRDGSNTVTGPFRNKMKNDTLVNSYERIYYKYPFQSVFGTIGFNPDDGVFLGPTFKYIRHGFRKTPYKSLNQFKGLFAFSTKAVRLTYNNEFISVFGRKSDLTTEIDYKGPNNTTNFFGYGMNSVYDKTKPKKFKFYRIRYDLGDIYLALRHRFSEKVSLSVGPTYQFYSYDSTDEFNKIRNVEVNNMSGLNQAVFDKRQSYWGAKLLLNVDTRDLPSLPMKGITWNTMLRFQSGVGKNSYDNVSSLNSDFSFYLPLAKDWLVFADRIGGGINLSDNYEFFQAQYLGGNEDLRGYRRERFAGKSKFYNQAELRWKWANLHTYLFPASIGMVVFLDMGRVWVPNDNVSKFGTGYGAGIWFAPLRRFVISVSYAKSSEDGIPLVGLGWRF